MKVILFLIVAAVSSFGQTNYSYVATTGNVSLSSATTAATLQQPSTEARDVSFPLSTNGGAPPPGASIYCSVACVATIARTCTTPASATAGTVTGVSTAAPTPFVTMWTASNASGCTTLRVINIGAGVEYPIDLSQFALVRGSNTSNLTISIASLTGTVNISFYPVESH